MVSTGAQIMPEIFLKLSELRRKKAQMDLHKSGKSPGGPELGVKKEWKTENYRIKHDGT
jgi:hypothetical protein